MYCEGEYERYLELFYHKFMGLAGISNDTLESAFPFVINLEKYLDATIKELDQYASEHATTQDFAELHSRYRLQNESYIFSVYGCLGYRDRGHATVARSIATNKNITFSLLLGDNIYPSGITARNNLDDFFINAYFQSGYLPPITFACLGNHDYHYHGHHPNFAQGTEIALQQVNYSHSRSELTGFKMPYRYYAVSSREFIIIVLDSNTLPWDEKQQEWLNILNQKLDGLNFNGKRFIAMHHPLQTYSKRIIKHDCQLYAGGAYQHGSTLLLQYRDRPRRDLPPLSELLKDFFYNNNIKFDFVLCAHDHYPDAMPLPDFETKTGVPVQITASPTWSTRSIKSIKLDKFHTQESELIKQIFGYKSWVSEKLPPRLLYPIFCLNRFSGSDTMASPADTAASFDYYFVNAESNEKIDIKQNTASDITEHLVDNVDILERFTKILQNDELLRKFWRGFGRSKIPKTMNSLAPLIQTPFQTQSDSGSLLTMSTHKYQTGIYVKGILQKRHNILPSIGSQISGILPFFARMTHIPFAKRHPATNGFYYYLPRIFKAMYRQLQNKLRHKAFCTEESIVYDQLSRFFPDIGRDVSLSQATQDTTASPFRMASPGMENLDILVTDEERRDLLSFPGYGGDEDAIDTNDEE